MSAFPESPFRETACKGRVVLVTGGGSGIGFEISRQFALHGAAVVIMGRREHALQAACESIRKDGGRIAYCQGDVRDFESCKKTVAMAVEKFGYLDTLVNCAAGNFLAPAEGISPKGFQTVVGIDLFGTFNMSTAAFPELKSSYISKHADPVILNITAEFNYPPFFQSHAAAAKMAINSLTRSHSLEWADYGIRVNGIAPGPIAGTTGLAKLGMVGSGDVKAAEVANDRRLPQGLKFGATWDIGMASIFYCSAAGRYCSGDIMTVDGGSYLRTGVKRKPDGWLDVDRAAVSNISKGRETTLKKKAVGLASKL